MSFSPLISVVMPVYKEADLQQRLAPLVYQQCYPDFEIWVVDGDPQGESIEGLKLPHVSTLISPQPGRGPQMNAGAKQAQGEILLFLHADTQLPVDGLAQIAERLRCEPQLAGGAFDLGIAAPQAHFRLLERVSSWRSRFTRLPYGDQALFIRRAVFESLGGYAPLPLMEDVELGQRLKAVNLSLGFMSQRVCTSARRWQQEGWLYTTLRNWTLLSLYLAGVSPHKLVRFYR